jgi:succinate-semialdehyde dehydrogenase / glutarate-semialdehyde dehydrogenase
MTELISINPSNKKVLGKVQVSSEKEIYEKVIAARKAKEGWKNLEVTGRVKILRNVIESILAKKEELAKLASSEMGMPISLTRADVDDSIDFFNWYLDNAQKYLSPEIISEDEKTRLTVYREPMGVSANITPWNFPISNFIWATSQSLVSGNVVIYKTSEEVPLSGKLIEEIMNESDLPEGVFSEVYGDGNVGKILVNGDIDLICFTGSTKVGKYLYKVAADKFIKVFLELGGSSPGIVFEDADVDRVLESIFANRFLYSGQVCDGLKRLIVHDSKKDEILEKLSARLQKSKVGDALNEEAEIGPLVSEKQLNILQSQVKDAIDKGAKVVIGGKTPKNLPGYFFEPTILDKITPDMKVWKEEVFGPVLPIVTFKTEEEAIELANDTSYGLGSYVFSEDKEKVRRVAHKIEAGMVSTNNAGYIKPSSPFGGCKDSGIGREHGKFGFYELTQVKVVAEEK